MYAYYEPQLYNVTFSGSHVSFSLNPLKVPYTLASQITLTPASGYYFESMSCSNGYTVTGFKSGSNNYSNQTITITNNTYVGGGTCNIKMHARSYAATYNPKTCTEKTNCREEKYCVESESCDPWYCPDWGSSCVQEHGGSTQCGCHQIFGSTCCKRYSTHTVCDTRTYDCPYYTCPNGGSLSGTTCVFS